MEFASEGIEYMEERALCTLMCAAYSPLYSAAHAQSTGNVPDISALLSVFSGTMPHARCASHRNGAVHDMVQPPLQSPAVHPHGTASQIETRDHMRIDHKAASGIVNNLIRYQKAGIGGSHDADQHVCCCTAGSQNTAGPIHTAYSYRAGGRPDRVYGKARVSIRPTAPTDPSGEADVHRPDTYAAGNRCSSSAFPHHRAKSNWLWCGQWRRSRSACN